MDSNLDITGIAPDTAKATSEEAAKVPAKVQVNDTTDSFDTAVHGAFLRYGREWDDDTPTIIAAVTRAHKAALASELKKLLEQGHGGGNWRRLINEQTSRL